MKRLMMLVAVVLAISAGVGAQDIVARCGTVTNQADFVIYVASERGGIAAPVQPGSSRKVCRGR